ncbi:hypothetical protein C8R43DRAFT_698237 [Mycena crocata]|nr:hypothetical protein C8R43DRAFT_698237 [Mycena crocata]
MNGKSVKPLPPPRLWRRSRRNMGLEELQHATSTCAQGDDKCLTAIPPSSSSPLAPTTIATAPPILRSELDEQADVPVAELSSFLAPTSKSIPASLTLVDEAINVLVNAAGDELPPSPEPSLPIIISTASSGPLGSDHNEEENAAGDDLIHRLTSPEMVVDNIVDGFLAEGELNASQTRQKHLSVSQLCPAMVNFPRESEGQADREQQYTTSTNAGSEFSCNNCGVTDTMRWHWRNEGQAVCNFCALFRAKHDFHHGDRNNSPIANDHHRKRKRKFTEIDDIHLVTLAAHASSSPTHARINITDTPTCISSTPAPYSPQDSLSALRQVSMPTKSSIRFGPHKLRYRLRRQQYIFPHVHLHHDVAHPGSSTTRGLLDQCLTRHGLLDQCLSPEPFHSVNDHSEFNTESSVLSLRLPSFLHAQSELPITTGMEPTPESATDYARVSRRRF